jgi:hypothetical protein
MPLCPLCLNPPLRDWRKIRLPHPKAAVNTPHSRRFARFGDARHSRSVWTAVALAPLLDRMEWLGSAALPDQSNGNGPAPESPIAGLAKDSFAPSESGGERAALQTLRAVWRRPTFAKRLDCGGFSTAFEGGMNNQVAVHLCRASQTGMPLRLNPPLRDWRKESFPPSESGGEHAAFQTLRAVWRRPTFAKRLDCVWL